MGDFDALYRLGLASSLTGHDDVEVFEAHTDTLVANLVAAGPDVVVLDEQKRQTAGLVEQITHLFPAIRVIVCSSKQPRMRVYPPFHRGESYTSPLDAAQFERAVAG